MKKTLISAALALGFAGAAQAQMTLYGLVDMSYGKSLFSEAFLGSTKADIHSGGDNGSSEGNSTTRVGIKGSTDLGGGIKGNFRFETGGIDSDGEVNGGGNFFNRQAWAGFSGGFGEVRVGRQDSVSFQQMIDFDFNGASNGVSAGGYSGVGVWLPGRQSRSVQYISPNMGGAGFQIGVQPKGNGGAGAVNVFSVGGKFGAGPVTVGATYETKRTDTAKPFASVAGAFDFGMGKVMLGYANGGKVADGGSGAGPTVGVNFSLAGINLGMHYSRNTDKALKIDSAEFWVNKEVFKNTYAYAEAGNWKSDMVTIANGKKKATAYALGMIWVF